MKISGSRLNPSNSISFNLLSGIKFSENCFIAAVLPAESLPSKFGPAQDSLKGQIRADLPDRRRSDDL